MKKTRSSDFSDRSVAAADARLKLVEAHRAAREAAEPTRLERQAERLAVATARDQRRAERDAAKRAAQEQADAEAAALSAAAEAASREEAEAREKAKLDLASRVMEDEAARKAERDRRYANRKARQR
ncbi:DUF6481 family protein [Pannonibacter sp. SL95]|uniref:DUF6481 family protein n=1 Tax=Pannonibacter sp. SL95 TaxID=2995153 RepID=UPI0022754B52|nr:DUF6481 family protein [Pannonibacter sp. SL95]MCY1706017.1 DUF6481 family protein [Pannonibacter sp. SL95]